MNAVADPFPLENCDIYTEKCIFIFYVLFWTEILLSLVKQNHISNINDGYAQIGKKCPLFHQNSVLEP